MTVEIVSILLDALTKLAILGILVGFAWLEVKIGKNKNLNSINTAKMELRDAAVTTVGELNQLFVEGWKAAGGGKLKEEQKAYLKEELIDLAMRKMSKPALNLLEAAKVDGIAYLTGIAEDWISNAGGASVGIIDIPMPEPEQEA